MIMVRPWVSDDETHGAIQLIHVELRRALPLISVF
jgi:hypothetical protein